MPDPVAIHTRHASTRRERILAHLAAHPDLAAGELARALGLNPPLNPLLRNMEAKAQITASQVWWPQQGRQVNVWRVAPPGTVPPQLASEVAAHRRELARLGQRRQRARTRGLVVPRGAEVPDLRALSDGFTLPPGAACAGTDPDLFFPDPGQDDTGARAICARCPIRRECYTLALATGQRYGIWGGINFEITAAHRQEKAS
jgi:Transcription factor WhiB